MVGFTEHARYLVPVLVGLFAWHPSPLLIVMAILAMPQLKRAWHYDPASPENVRYYGIAPSVKLTYAFYYLALLAFLAMMTFGIHDMLGPLRGRRLSTYLSRHFMRTALVLPAACAPD